MHLARTVRFGALLLCGCSVDVPLELKACDSTGACAAGFRCVTDVCVAADGRGQLDAPCRQRGPACDDGLECVNNTCRPATSADAGVDPAPDGGGPDADLPTPRVVWRKGPPFAAGALLPLSIEVGPDFSAASLSLTTTLGTFETAVAGSTGPTIVLARAALSETVWLRVPLSTRPGTELMLTASPPLANAERIVITAPELVTTSIGTATASIARGLSVESPVVIPESQRATFLSNFRSVGFSTGDKIFPLGPFFGVVRPGQRPAIYRRDDEFLTLFASSDGPTGPDESLGQLLVPPPGSPYPSQLYVCSASPGGGDGIFGVSPLGVFSLYADFNNCNGIAFDRNRVVQDPGYATPLYVARDTEVVRFNVSRAVDARYEGLPPMRAGYRLLIPQSGWMAGALVLLGANQNDLSNASVLLLRPIDDRSADVQTFAPSVPGLLSGAALNDTTWGDVLLLAHGSTGELRIYTEDGTSIRIASGLAFPWIARNPRTGEIWIAEQDRPSVLRLVPERPR